MDTLVHIIQPREFFSYFDGAFYDNDLSRFISSLLIRLTIRLPVDIAAYGLANIHLMPIVINLSSFR